MKYFGARMQRLEDPALLTGRGRFVDDIHLDGHAARCLRAQPARARANPRHRRRRGARAARRARGLHPARSAGRHAAAAHPAAGAAPGVSGIRDAIPARCRGGHLRRRTRCRRPRRQSLPRRRRGLADAVDYELLPRSSIAASRSSPGRRARTRISGQHRGRVHPGPTATWTRLSPDAPRSSTSRSANIAAAGTPSSAAPCSQVTTRLATSSRSGIAGQTPHIDRRNPKFCCGSIRANCA